MTLSNADIDYIENELKQTGNAGSKIKWPPAASVVHWYNVFERLESGRSVAPPVSSLGRGLGALAYSDPTVVFPDPSIYDYVITAFQAPALSCKRQLHYVSCISVNTEWWSGVDVATAKSKGVLLTDSSNNLLLNRGYPTNFIGDPGSQVYRDEWVKQVIAHCASNNVKYLFCDDCVATPIGLTTSYPKLYSTDTIWQNVMVSFFVDVYPKLKAAGIELYVNAGGYIPGNVQSNGGYTDKALWSSIVNYVDGLHNEYFMQAPSDNTPYFDAPTIDSYKGNWKSWLDLIDIAQNAGKAFLGTTTLTTEQQKRFSRASFLMRWNGIKGAVIIVQNAYVNGVNPASAQWINNPGMPKSGVTQVGACYKRSFDNMVVYVNPSKAPQVADGHNIPAQDALFV